MLSKAEADERIKLARAEAALQARQEYEQKLEVARTSIAAALRAFETERAEYYARVEAEVVQLALAIAAKILHREAQVDPMLVAALVRMATEKMRDGSSVTVRVGRGNGKRWKEFFDRQPGVRASRWLRMRGSATRTACSRPSLDRPTSVWILN
jgi:flagellar biosynthesis/type III secretory pathway protein FliH